MIFFLFGFSICLLSAINSDINIEKYESSSKIKLKATDFCVIKEVDCYINCIEHEKKCEGKYKYPCGLQYCAKSEEVCEKFQNLVMFVDLIKNPLSYESKINKIKLLKMNIGTCHLNAYEWSSPNMTLNRKDCSLREESDSYLIKLVDCSFKQSSINKNFSQELCTLHKAGCSSYNLINSSRFLVKSKSYLLIDILIILILIYLL